MAETTNKRTIEEEDDNDDDYLGDLSQFLPSEASLPAASLSKKITNKNPSMIQSTKKKLKNISWQERRKIERESKQQVEDEQTIANIEAPIPQSNIGFKMLKQMGYTPGLALGKEGSGLAEPVGLEIRRSRAGIGREDPHKEMMKRDEIMAEKKRQKVDELLEDFGSRQKLQWRNRRIVVNFEKAKRVLDQLENEDVVEPAKNEDEEKESEEEEEEEEITEEDLQDILMKLRDEHQYCLFCGCKYESAEALSSDCPGVNEDDH